MRPALVFLWLLCSYAATAQDYDPNKTFTPEQVKEDMQVLYGTLKSAYPALYRFQTKAEVEKTYNTLTANIKQPLTASEVTRDAILPFVVSLKDLHFVVHPSKAGEEYLRTSGKYFPFDIKLAGGKMYLWRNASKDPDIADKGNIEIVKINGADIKTMVAKLEPYIVTDGNSKVAKRHRDLEESFRTYYAIVYGRPDKYVLDIKKDGKAQQLTVDAMNWDKLNGVKAERYQEQQKLYGLSIIDNKVALLTVRTFTPETIPMLDKYFEQFIDSSFKILNDKGIRNLILDLRSNIGGRTNFGGRLYSHLAAKPFKYVDRVEVAFPHTFPTITHTSLGKSYLTNTYGIRRMTGDTSKYSLETYQWTFAQQPSPVQYDGKLYVLTDAYTMSSAALLASMIKANYPGVVFIGEETGGTYTGFTGTMPTLTLPNTQTRVYFPLRYYVSGAAKQPEKNKGYKDRGVIPDVTITPTLEDLMKDRDVAFEKAIEMINK